MGLFNNWKALVSGFPSVMEWNRYTKAIAGMRGQNGVRVFLQNGGAVIEGTEASRGRMAFEVYQIAAGAVAIKGGYLQSQAGVLTAAPDVATVAVSGNLFVWARYDLGLAGTSTPAWEVASGSFVQTGSAMPAYSARYRVIPIASVTWDLASSAIGGITQHNTGLIECPDMREAGIVEKWSGSIATIPYGFALCDGNNSTVDLRKKFIYGANATDNSPGASGGAANHMHTGYTVDAGAFNHAHNYYGLNPWFDGGSGGDFQVIDFVSGTQMSNMTGAVGVSGGSTESNIPPFYALAFIQHL